MKPPKGSVEDLKRQIRELREEVARGKQAESHFRTIVESTSDLYLVLSADGTFLEYYTKDKSVLYVPPENFIGKKASDILPREIAKIHEAAVAKAKSSGKPVSYEYSLPIKSGATTHFEARLSPIDNDKLSVIVRDISERKQTEEALRSSEQRFREIAENLDEVFWVGTPYKAEALYVSPSYEKVFGTSIQSVYDNIDSWRKLVHPDDKKRVEEHLQSCLKTGHMDVQYRIVRPDGELRWVHTRGFPIHDEKGSFVRISGTTQDVTQIKHAEESLRQSKEELEKRVTERTEQLRKINKKLKRQIETRKKSEAQFRTVADTVPGFITIHRGEKFLYANKAAEAVTGYTREELLKLSFWSLCPPDYQRLLRSRSELRLEGRKVPPKYEIQFRTKSGDLRWLFLSVAVIEYEGQPAVLGTGHDVTERKQAEAELKKAKELADAANRAKSEFLANMSHEIRTPIGAILGFAEMLQIPGLNERERGDYVQGIQRNGQHLLELINDILDLSKIEAGEFKVTNSHFSLQEELCAILSMIQQRVEEKRLKVEIEYDGPVPNMIYSDPTRFRQILINIIGNAVKFTMEGTIRIIVKLIQGTESDPHRLEIRVMDTGIGISQDQQRRLFEPFSQGEHTFSRRFGGTGLGLALARKHARALGGDVVLESSETRRGSEFLVTIDPGSLDHVEFNSNYYNTAQDNLSSLPLLESQKPLKGFDILLVEDGVDNQILFTHFLESAGARVQQAMDGREAFQMALQNTYDVVLMDIQLPILDGYQATKRLREKDYERPIVALTAHAMKEERERCLNAGCNDCLTKPIEAAKLITEVEKWATNGRIAAV